MCVGLQGGGFQWKYKHDSRFDQGVYVVIGWGGGEGFCGVPCLIDCLIKVSIGPKYMGAGLGGAFRDSGMGMEFVWFIQGFSMWGFFRNTINGCVWGVPVSGGVEVDGNVGYYTLQVG